MKRDESPQTPSLAQFMRPLPVPDLDSAPYWEALAQKQLCVQRCSSCNRLRFPPMPLCHHCHSWEFDWIEVFEGFVHSWVVVNEGIIQALVAEAPYVVALVDVGDGAHVPGNLEGIDLADIRDRTRVRVDFRTIAEGVVIPVFRVIEADEA